MPEPDWRRPPGLRITRDQAGLAAIASWCDAVIRVLDLDRRPAYALRLCLEEAVANLVMHARPTSACTDDVIELEAEADAGGCVLIVRDHCEPFAPDTGADAPSSVTLAGDRVGGAGLHLLRHFATDIEYLTQSDGNRLTIQIGPAARL